MSEHPIKSAGWIVNHLLPLAMLLKPSLFPRFSHSPVSVTFSMQKMVGEGLVHFTTWVTSTSNYVPQQLETLPQKCRRQFCLWSIGVPWHHWWPGYATEPKSKNAVGLGTRLLFALYKSAQERGAWVRPCNSIKFESRWNLLPALRIVTHTAQLHADINHCC